MRFTPADVDRLCDLWLTGAAKGPCMGCKLHEQLAKKPALRSKTFLARMESRVKKLRKK